tara:strand:+ start:1703 stop:1861 length:159 start_codon:yes stop_codon:yes gene_type:complete
MSKKSWVPYREWLLRSEFTNLEEKRLAHKWKKELKDKNDRELKIKTQSNDND